MANGLKRSAAQEPQSRNKKTKTPVAATRASDGSNIVSSPSKGIEDFDAGDSESAPNFDQTVITALQKVQTRFGKEDQWPRKFGKHLDQKQAEVLESLQSVRQKLLVLGERQWIPLTEYSVSDRTTFESAILPILRKALGPIDDDEAPEIEDESMLDVPFTAAIQQKYFEEVSALLASSHGLINSYTRLSKQEIPRSRLGEVAEMYRKDRATALSLLAAGRRVAGQDVEEMLADRRNEVRGRSSLTREDEQKGRMLLLEGEGEGNGNRGGLGWGEVASDLKKVVKKLDGVGRPAIQ